jgi:hypothetical protein
MLIAGDIETKRKTDSRFTKELEQGWSEIFLNLDPERGLKARQRWPEAASSLVNLRIFPFSRLHAPWQIELDVGIVFCGPVRLL